MPRLHTRPPKMSLVKSTGEAVVYVNRKRKYLGPWGSDIARERYHQFLEAWAASNGTLPDESTGNITIAQVVAAYLDWAETNLDRSHFFHSRTVAAFLVDLHGHTPVEKFGPKALVAVREQMEKSGRFSRNYINDLVSRARTIFKWGVGQELVPESVSRAIGKEYVQPLRKGRTVAPETEPRENVPDEIVDRTLPYLFPTNAAMVQVQRLAVMRPNEVCRMRVGEIDQSRKDGIWIYQPILHKGTWRGHGKAVALGTPEQELIAPRLVGKAPESAVFSPRDAMAEKKEQGAANRKTKVQPSQQKRAAQRKKVQKSRIREFYDSNSYRQAIEYGIARANKTLPPDQQIPHWTPYQLRHSGVTELAIENTGNRDIARAVAGHQSTAVTELYHHADVKIAIAQAVMRSR